MQTATSSSCTLPRVSVLCSVFATSLLLAACGDDGTDGLSDCPDYRIQVDESGNFQCAPPRAGNGGAPGTGGTAGTPRAGTGTTQPNSQQPPKPAAGSGGTAAANGGSGGLPAGAPPIPKGGTWACVQVANTSTCTCAMVGPAVDNCTKPLQSCCMLVREGDKYTGCICYAESNVACNDAKQDPMTYVPVSTCPP